MRTTDGTAFTMELSPLKTYLINKLAVTEELPFGPEALVYKVSGKMYALVAWQETPLKITLKVDPAQADLQRAMFDFVFAQTCYP